MGQGAVRLAVQQGIQGQEFPLVGTVFAGRAYIDEQDYEINAAKFYVENEYGSSCVIVVNLPGPDKRTRLTLTGRQSVDDMNVHPVVLELFFANREGDPIQAQFDYDSVVDAIVPWIRNNQTLGSPDVVWSAGEYEAGVVVQSSSPFVIPDGTTVFINGVIRFEAWEQIVGPNGV
jgi:hypothetical protein